MIGKRRKLYSGGRLPATARRQAERRAAEITREFQDTRAAKDELAPADLTTTHVVDARPVRERVQIPVTDELLDRLERAHGAELRRAEEAMAREALAAKWRPWEGTPETNERIDRVPTRRRQSPLSRMLALGKISREEFGAAEQIASIVEQMERAVSVRAASLESRVDCSGSSTDVLVESIGRIRLEVAYRAWREAIPAPKRMIIDMITTNEPYVGLARLHRLQWRTARKRLITALRMWPEFEILARHTVKREDVNLAYERLGAGVLLPPRPRTPQPATEETEQ